MADFLMEFEWPRAPKYELVFREPEDVGRLLQIEAPEDRGRAGFFGVGGGRLRTGRYVLVAKGEPKMFKPSHRLLDACIEKLLPVGRADYIRTDVEADPKNREVIHAVATSLGLLMRQSKSGDSEDVSRWAMVSRLIYFIVEGKGAAGTEAPAGDLRVRMLYQSGRPTLAIGPGDLGNALFFHAARSRTSGVTARSCEHCGLPFLVGGPRRKGARRAGTRFHSEQCRWDYNNARRAKG